MSFPPQTIPSALLARVLTTVDINGIATPFNQSLNSLQRFCRPVLFYKEDFAFELAYSGSAFLFRHQGHNFLICCKHQVRYPHGEFSPSAICFVINEDGKNIAISPNASTSVKIDSYYDRTNEDILLVEYHAERDRRPLDRYFLSFDLDEIATLSTVPESQIILIFSIGYPTRFSDYEITFDESEIPVTADVVSRWVKLYLQEREREGWDLETRIPLKVHERYHAEIGDPDGFSGSPVFFIWQDDTRQTHLGFAGMITHGNSGGAFQIYPAETIKEIIAEAIRIDPQPEDSSPVEDHSHPESSSNAPSEPEL
jgi:hypothetical protein